LRSTRSSLFPTSITIIPGSAEARRSSSHRLQLAKV
jgi:hypothetical protein